MCLVETDLNVRSAVWKFGDDAYAVLFCEDANDTVVLTGTDDEISAIFSVVHKYGLPWLQPTTGLRLDMVENWKISLDRSGQLTIDWPAPTKEPFLTVGTLRHPPGWLDAAQETGVVILLCCRSFGAIEFRDLGDVLAEAMETGGLAGATVPFQMAG